MAVNANGTKCGVETMILQNLFIVFGRGLLHSAFTKFAKRAAIRNSVQHLLVAVSSCRNGETIRSFPAAGANRDWYSLVTQSLRCSQMSIPLPLELTSRHHGKVPLSQQRLELRM
jgi:hypothetical protein